MMRSGLTIKEFCENIKVARELAVVGNYEDASVYYQGAISFMNHYINTLNEQSNIKTACQQRLHEVKIEYEILKDAREILRSISLHFDSPLSTHRSHIDDENEYLNLTSEMWQTDPDVWPPNLADKDKWPTPTTVDQ